MIETIELPELVIIGILVETPFEALPERIERAWRDLLAGETGATSFLAASLAIEDGQHREVVGYLGAHKTDVPEGMVKVVLPAQPYLRIAHDGPVGDIATAFKTLRAHAAATGLKTSGVTLDFGYLRDGGDGRHELHVALAPEPLRLS